MVVTLFAGLSTGFVLYNRLFYALGLTVAVSFIWGFVSLLSLNVTVRRFTRKVQVGDDVVGEVDLQNPSILPRPVLEVRDTTDIPGHSGGVAVTLPGRKSRTTRLSTSARTRGIYNLGPVRVSNTDSFGLFRREKVFGGTESVIVYPRVYDVAGFWMLPTRLAGESSAGKRSHDLTPHAASVRDYSSGDGISRVHWSSTARLGRLMSKEFDRGRSSDVWLLVDLFKGVQAGQFEESTDERAVTIAASLAQMYLKAQIPVGLIAQGDKRYFLAPDTGSGQLDRIMESLAMSKAEGAVPMETTLSEEEILWGPHSSLVVITPSNRSEWVTALKELTRLRTKTAAVLLDRTSFGGDTNTLDVVPDLHDAGILPYVVRKGDDISAALSEPYIATKTEVTDGAPEVKAAL